MFEFASPWLLVLLAAPWPAMRWLPGRSVSGGVLAVPERIGDELLRSARRQGEVTSGILHRLLPWLAWSLFVFALAGPRQILPVPALEVSGRDLAIALDLSGSMVREDFHLDGRTVTRLQAVKAVGADFVRRRAGDRVALIMFGSKAYFAAPFSFDTEAVARRIEEATIGIPGRATNISDALGLALKRFEHSPTKTRVVILLSDGVNNAGATNPRGVAQLAASMDVRVHTIALGPLDLATAAPGERGVVDAATLKAIATMSGGRYFRVRNTADLEAVMSEIDQLEATASDGLAAEIFKEYWVWPAGLATILCLGLAWREVR